MNRMGSFDKMKGKKKMINWNLSGNKQYPHSSIYPSQTRFHSGRGVTVHRLTKKREPSADAALRSAQDICCPAASLSRNNSSFEVSIGIPVFWY